MAKIGLNNLWYTHLTEADDGTPTYDGAKSFGKAVSANVSISNNSATLYADDVLAESDTSFQSGTVTLGVDDDREATFADVLGHEITEEGEVIRNANDTAPWVALGRIVVKMVGNVRSYKVEILNKVKFSEPSQEDQTKGESVEFSTPEIEGTIATLANGDWSDSKVFTTKDEAIAFIKATFAAPIPPEPVGTTYEVSYNANGGTGTIDPVTVDAGESITVDNGSTLTAPEDKTFAGWALSAEATEATIAGGSSYTPTADVELFAVWADNV